MTLLRNESTLFIESQGTAARESFTGRRLNNQKCVTLNRDVERIACRLDVTLRAIGHRVGRSNRVVHHASEDALLLEAGRVDVGEVVRDRLLAPLVERERGGGTGETGVFEDGGHGGGAGVCRVHAQGWCTLEQYS